MVSTRGDLDPSASSVCWILCDGNHLSAGMMKLPAVTGKAYGENKMATTQPFQKMAMNWKGLLNFPRLHLGLGNVFGVSTSLARQIRPYAAAEGTPAAETRLVNAVLDGRIVQVIMAETTQTTITAFLGWPKYQSRCGENSDRSIEPEGYYTDNVHDDVPALAKDHGIKWYEWLLRTELEEENTSGCTHTGVLRLLCHMARGIKSDQDTSSSQIRQTPVPASRCSCTIKIQRKYLGGSRLTMQATANMTSSTLKTTISARSGRPPSHDEAEKASKSRSACLSSPEVYRPSERQRGAYLCDDSGCNECEDAGHNVGSPIGEIASCANPCGKCHTNTSHEIQRRC
ncbi:amino acid transporter, partial [Aureobasidium melanogenum]